MISRTKAVAILAEATHIPESKIDAMSERLVTARIIPVSEGRSHGKLDINVFCYLMIAILVSSPSQNSIEIANNYYNLPLNEMNSIDKSYETAGDYIEYIFKSFIKNNGMFRKEMVRITLSHPHISIRTSETSPSGAEYGTDSSEIKTRSFVEIPPAVLSILARLWSDAAAQPGPFASVPQDVPQKRKGPRKRPPRNI